MRNLVIILLLALFWSCTSCNESNPEKDGLTSDKDQTVSDQDTPDKSDNDQNVSDSSDDKIPDTNDTDLPDNDIAEEEFIDDCDVKLIDAPFPYTDNDGKLTFCRPGCDTPTEKDPQCMSNLWREQNYNLCHEHPEYDCCGYPCVLESLKPMTKEEVDEYYQLATIPMHKCDLKLNPKDWGIGGSSVMKSWNMSENKIGFYLYTVDLSMKDWPVKAKFSTYEIDTKKFNNITPAKGQMQSYYKGHRIALISDKRSLELNNSNIYLSYIGDDGSSHLAYNKPVNFLAYEPALNDKWAFVNLQETESSPYKMMYAKVGEWKWVVLGEGTLRMPSLSGNMFALFTEGMEGYICDLDKTPKSFSDCYRINQGDEGVRYVVFDKENSNRAVYSSTTGKIVLMEYVNGKWEYNDLITSYSDEIKDYAIGFIVNMFQGSIMLYEEAYQLSSSSDYWGNKLCYYNFTNKKSYCMKRMEKDTEYNGVPVYPYGDAEFEGKWLLYQKLNSTPLILRDMECYCKEEGVCPFE